MEQAAPQETPSKTVEVVRGQYHAFMLIPIQEHHAQWFPAGPVTLAVEARALGTSLDHMVRGPSIHVFSADREREFLRFDLFGTVLHYHYILNGPAANVVWGYDDVANGPMLPWVIAALSQRLPAMLRRAGEAVLAGQVEAQGWGRDVLGPVEAAAAAALAPRADDLERALEGMAWMARWKEVHPQFNTV